MKKKSITKAEMEKIKKMYKPIKPDRVDIYMNEQAKKDKSKPIRYYPGMLD